MPGAYARASVNTLTRYAICGPAESDQVVAGVNALAPETIANSPVKNAE